MAELVEQVVPREILLPALDERLPWRERFRDREALEEALMDAGLRHIRTEVRRYRFTYTLRRVRRGARHVGDGSLRPRRCSARRRTPRSSTAAASVFADRFADPLNDFRDVLLAVGAKP